MDKIVLLVWNHTGGNNDTCTSLVDDILHQEERLHGACYADCICSIFIYGSTWNFGLSCQKLYILFAWHVLESYALFTERKGMLFLETAF